MKDTHAPSYRTLGRITLWTAAVWLTIAPAGAQVLPRSAPPPDEADALPFSARRPNPSADLQLPSRLLPTTWQRWQSFDPVQKKQYIATLRRYTQATPEQRDRLQRVHEMRTRSPETLNRLMRLLPAVRAFVQSLTPSEVRRLRNMTPEARARIIAQSLAQKRLTGPQGPTAPGVVVPPMPQ